MIPNIQNYILLVLILITLVTQSSPIDLWFPRYTILQVTMAMVLPYEHPVYKVNMNYGLQCNFGLPWNSTEFIKPPYWDQRSGDLLTKINEGRFKRDVSAGEFYTEVESVMESHGYHSSCIMKSVCEMAQHSFHIDEDNALTMILHYLFTPSLHDSFEDHEINTERRYKRAETIGHQGGCNEYYKNCPRTPIEEISFLE